MRSFLRFVAAVLLLFSGSAFAGEVRIAYLQSDIHQLPCWVAMDKGFFAKEGVSVSVVGIFKAGPELMNAFSAGVLDMGYVGVAPAMTAVANKTADVVLVAQVNSEGSGVVVGKRGIRSMLDLTGKVVAIPGYSTVQDALFRKALIKAKMVSDQFRIIILKPPEMIGALRTDQIDAFVAWEPYPAKAVSMGVGKVLMMSGDIWRDHPCCVLAADRRFLDKNMETVRKMVRAHSNAIEYILKNKNEAITIAVKHTGMDETSIESAINNVKYTSELNVQGVKDYGEFLVNLKYVKIDDINVFANRFISADFVRDAILNR